MTWFSNNDAGPRLNFRWLDLWLVYLVTWYTYLRAMLFWNFQTYLTMSCHHTLFYFPVLELLHNTSKLPWLFACILLYIFSLLPHLLLICSIIKFLKYLWTENIISVTFISLMMTFYLLFQGCKCHEVASDETCLDCLRSKCNIGRYVKIWWEVMLFS